MGPRLGTTLADRYRIERELGQGGMAVVYLAYDLRHDRQVAIKVLRPEITAALGSARFLQEIRVSAQLDHRHILTLMDSDSADGVLYYVLPYVRGESLRQKLTRKRQLSIEETLFTPTPSSCRSATKQAGAWPNWNGPISWTAELRR